MLGFRASRMKPLVDRAKEGRANPSGIPVLYIGTTVRTAISEVRPWVGANVSLATCKLLSPLRVLDLSLGHGKSSLSGSIFSYILGVKELTAQQKEKAVWTDIDNAFSTPVTRSDDKANYAPTQILAELFRSAGYDAIAYKSHFGDEGYNIAIFDLDSVDVVSCAPYQVKTINIIAEQVNNAWYKTSS
ncbi:RES family NAD+ phosphorylase [Providencia rettgeri]|uniref:RES family NAD+ phosphorylase n=1 Tax=Providencia rettgeri TaxID=587 RepID=UPI001CA63857